MTLLWTDRALLERFRAGDPDVLSAVYWEYVRKVERLLSAGFVIRNRGTRVAGVNQPDDIADLVQEVFLRAFSKKARQGYDGLRDYGPYLYAISRNVLVDRARAHGREMAASWTELETAMEPVPDMDPLAPWERPATMRVVEEYLEDLPDTLRSVHRLRHQEGLSQEQAAQQLGVGRQTLRTLERRLQDGLAAALDAAGLSPTDEEEPLQAFPEQHKTDTHETQSE